MSPIELELVEIIGKCLIGMTLLDVCLFAFLLFTSTRSIERALILIASFALVGLTWRCGGIEPILAWTDAACLFPAVGLCFLMARNRASSQAKLERGALLIVSLLSLVLWLGWTSKVTDAARTITLQPQLYRSHFAFDRGTAAMLVYFASLAAVFLIQRRLNLHMRLDQSSFQEDAFEFVRK